MGATTFIDSVDADSDVDSAFQTLRTQAQFEYGHAGYTGTIAEKNSWVVVKMAGNDLPEVADATREAHRLIDAGDPRIDSKWGPAGAIQTKSGWLFFGWASE